MASAANSNTAPLPADCTLRPWLTCALQAALPIGFTCKTRYIHSPPRPCDPLFSALPGQEHDKTRLASHFLAVSVEARSLPSCRNAAVSGDVISFAIEVLVYTTNRLTTIFVSKVDSTSYIPRIKPSLIRTTVTTFLRWLTDKERRKRPDRKIVISLFARAQAQYLFPGSSEDVGKHILDDRQLIKWWVQVLDPIIPVVGREGQTEDADCDHQGYLTVPGYAKTELRPYLPSSAPLANGPRWLPGHPLLELGQARSVPEHAPPRCLLPRFPDDPKARFIADLDDELGVSQDSQVTGSPSKRNSGRWNSVANLEQFWEQMEFRQECSSGRAVGFLWLVISARKQGEGKKALSLERAAMLNIQGPIVPSGAPPSPMPTDASHPHPQTAPTGGSSQNRMKKKRPNPLTGPIISRLPKIKSVQSGPSNVQAHFDVLGDGVVVSRDGYDKAISTLLHLDFSTLDIATQSTAKWITEILGLAGLNRDFGMEITGTAKANAAAALLSSSNPFSFSTITTTQVVNDMSNLIRKKRKAGGSSAVASETPAESPVRVYIDSLHEK